MPVQASNYRPISILPTLSKIIEKAINNRLVNYLEKYKLISDNQFGFRRGKSTGDAVSQLDQFVTTSLDGGSKCLAIFLDLAKAFDTVSIPLLLRKLESLGIRGGELQLFQSYLSNRRQRVKISSYSSTEVAMSQYGIPQGSIIGPTLFLIYINQICQMELANGKLLAFADDTVLLFRGHSWDYTFKIAQEGFTQVSILLNLNLLTLNNDKTKYLPFALRNNKLPDTSKLCIKSHSINCLRQHPITNCHCPSLDRCETFKYLGIIIDSKLNYACHIKKLTARVRKLIAVFRNVRHAANEAQLKLLYYALCHSLLMYCVTSWGGAAKTHMLPLERAQRAVLKVAFSHPYRFPTSQLYHECKILTCRQIFIQQTIVRQHLLPAEKCSGRRRDKIFQTNRCRTTFAQKHALFLAPYIYNKINKNIPIHSLSVNECKSKINEYLHSLTYDQTENIFQILS